MNPQSEDDREGRQSDGKKLLLSKIVCILAGCVFVICALFLTWKLFVQPAIADGEQQDIKKIYYMPDPPPSSGSPAKNREQVHKLTFEELRKVNPAIVGWIKVPNTIIDLPVLQADKKDPEYYLTHDYRNQSSSYGSIFADARCSVEKGKSRSVLLYGHSLHSGRMFTQLDKYKSLDFYKSAPVITFDTAEAKSQWKVVGVFLTNTLPEQGVPFNYLKTEFKSNSDFLNFVYQMRIRSIYNTDVSVKQNDSILLLSTCSYEFNDFREVVVARKVRDGESETVDVSKASYNNKVVYPDCWYKKNGGKKPVWPDTYEQAVRKKLITWGNET